MEGRGKRLSLLVSFAVKKTSDSAKFGDGVGAEERGAGGLLCSFEIQSSTRFFMLLCQWKCRSVEDKAAMAISGDRVQAGTYTVPALQELPYTEHRSTDRLASLHTRLAPFTRE